MNGIMLNQKELKEIESQAVDIISGAGDLLLQYFDKPLSVDYKSTNGRNPVTDADHAADEFILNQISKHFPGHTVVTEETENQSDEAGQFTWVVDPLDGTSNFLHHLPIFASMLCLLFNGIPLVSAIYLPKIGSKNGTVLHACKGGGAFEDGVQFFINNSEPSRLMASVPGYFLRMFSHKKNLRRQLGDLRSLGSAGYELAMTAKGSTDYIISSGPAVWDIAPGLLLVLEAGGAAVIREQKNRNWIEFESFNNQSVLSPTPSELRRWKATLMLGRKSTVDRISSGLSIKSYPIRDIKYKIKSIIGRQ